MNKELEKAAEEYSINGEYQFMSTFQQMAQKAFIAGANWQARNTIITDNSLVIDNPKSTICEGICSSASTISLNEDKEQVIIDGWVARDEDNMIYIFDEKPHKSEIEWHCGSLGSTMLIKKMLFPEVKWKDRKPTKVKLIIEKV